MLTFWTTLQFINLIIVIRYNMTNVSLGTIKVVRDLLRNSVKRSILCVMPTCLHTV